MASKILKQLLITAIIVSVTIQTGLALGVATLPTINCATVRCALPECSIGERLEVPEGQCCPQCVPRTPDCSAVICLRPVCRVGEKLVTPEGACCPQCGPIECEIEGQEFSTCASLCPATCNSPIRFCPLVCVFGCKCPSGQLIDTVNKRCVAANECPSVNPCDVCPKGTICRTEPVFCINPPCGPDRARCLDPDEICSLEPETGPCKALFRKFFYNSTTDQCEQFIYGGCRGNDNRFDTRSECISACDAVNPCDGFVCHRGSTCKVDDQTGEAFCEPSCELDNGGCLRNQTCQLQNVQCVRAPCPPVVNCIDRNPCATVLCRNGHQCKVFEPTGEPFCTPNCSLNNGGCRRDQICELQTVQCIRAPCPPVVNCIDRDPCATVRCANGYRCEVYEPTGEAFCNPDCNLNNGGCPADQECRLQRVTCVRAPCPPVIQCVERTECPPTCSREFCSRRSNRKAMCSNPGPREIPGCTGSCQLTYCHTCYYSEEARPRPPQCDRKRCNNVQDYQRNSSCFRRWAKCVRRAQWMLQRPDDGEIFRCQNPPCPFRG